MQSLSCEEIQRALTGVPFVRQVVYLPVVSSTNDVAHKLAGDNAPEGTLIIADEQTAGRGRPGRVWWAPPGTSLLMSLLLRPALQPLQALRLTMVAGLAAAEAVERATGLQVYLKWPNDIWIGSKKAGGILTEARLIGDHLEYAVVGLGLNVNVNFANQLELDGIATSLMMETGQYVDRLPILRMLLERFAGWYAGITTPQLKESWASRLITLGQQVSVQVDAQRVDGLAEAVDDDGALLVRTEEGRLHRLFAGDVSLGS